MKTREGNLPIPLPKMHPKTKPSFIIGLIFGITLGLPQLYADASFRSSFASGKVEQIEASLNLWPKSVTRMNITSKIFREANLNRESLRIAENALKFNPANYEAWKEYSLQRNISEYERKEAQRRLTALNSPYVRP